MPRQERTKSGTGIYHVMLRGVNKQDIFDGGYAKAERINSTAYGYTLFYYNQDHLGNIREVMNASGNLQQKTNYYPFGGIIADICAEQNIQPYKYNGKELDLMHGLNTYDYGARQYDPILCRWDRVDPLAEKNPDITPYHYCHNNPVNRVDPDGRDDLFDENGKFIERTKTGDAVMVMRGDQYQNITEVDFSNNQGAIENIGRHYLAKADKGDFNLTASSIDSNIPEGAVFSNDANTPNYNIYLTNGFVNKILGNCYNFECVTYHEFTHRNDQSTLGGTIGEVNAILRTATECSAWTNASDGYINSQAMYAADRLNQYGKLNSISNNVVHNLNKAFMGHCMFELNNNQIIVGQSLGGCTIKGRKR